MKRYFFDSLLKLKNIFKVLCRTMSPSLGEMQFWNN